MLSFCLFDVRVLVVANFLTASSTTGQQIGTNGLESSGEERKAFPIALMR